MSVTSDPPPCHLEPDEHSSRAQARSGALHEGRVAHCAATLVEFYHSAKPHIEWCERFAQFVAIERHPRLQTQRVPRAKSDRKWCGDSGRARVKKCAPNGDGIFRVEIELKSIFTRISGARYKHGDPFATDQRLTPTTLVVAKAEQRRTLCVIEERRGHFSALRSLNRNHCGGGALIGHIRYSPDTFNEECSHSFSVRRVCDYEPLVLHNAVNDEVVDHPTRLIHHDAVLRAPGL